MSKEYLENDDMETLNTVDSEQFETDTVGTVDSFEVKYSKAGEKGGNVGLEHGEGMKDGDGDVEIASLSSPPAELALKYSTNDDALNDSTKDALEDSSNRQQNSNNEKTNLMEAVEALEKLKNSSDQKNTLFTTFTNYYNSSKEYSPTFKVGAEFVEKRAAPIVRKFESKFPKKYMRAYSNAQRFNLSMSIESKKNLTTLLKFIRLANERLTVRIDNLQQMVSEREKKFEDDESSKRENSLANVKKDIVMTVKKAVMMISKVAGDSLPAPAKIHVRDVLLKLPQNLQQALRTDGTEQEQTAGKVSHNANKKILILAKESLDSFANIIKIFDSNLEKVDLWVEREKQKEIDKIAKLGS